MERERLEAELRSLSRVVGKQSRGKNAQQKAANGGGGGAQSNALGSEGKKGEGDVELYSSLVSAEGGSFIGGSNTHIPDQSKDPRSTLGVDEDGLEFGRSSFGGSMRGGKRMRRKYRRDNQTYCGTTGPAGKCSIF